MTKILVDDDADDILNLVIDDLTDDGFDVISAENGASALALISDRGEQCGTLWRRGTLSQIDPYRTRLQFPPSRPGITRP